MSSCAGGYFPGLDDQQWWLQYGLDGIVGALLAAAVAWLAVRATLQHERRQARLASLAEAVASLQARSFELSWQISRRTEQTDDAEADTNAIDAALADVVLQRRTASILAQGLAAKTWPGFSRYLGEVDDTGLQMPTGTPEEVKAGFQAELTNTAVICTSWLAEPRAFDPGWWQLQRRNELRKHPPGSIELPPPPKVIR